MRIAMIGAGAIANRHLEVLSREAGVEVAAHVAGRLESAERAASRWGGYAFGSVEELLDSQEIEAAWVTVPPHAHGAIELALIDRSVPIFVEKPLSAERQTAWRIAAALEGKGLVTAVGYQWRALDTVPRVLEEVARRPPRLILGRWLGTLPEPAWWRKRKLSGGQMVEQATHLFDLSRMIAGDARVLHAANAHQQRAEAADIDVAAASVATLRFESGALGSFSASNLLGLNGFVGLQVVCDGLLVTLSREGVIFEEAGGRREAKTATDPFMAIDRAFLRAVREGDPSLVLSSYEDAMRTHELVFDVAEAADRSS